jgi:ATP-dependent Clp protease protease subunit
MPANAMMMVHNPWAFGGGFASDLRKLADDLDRVRDGMLPAYESKTGMKQEELIALLDAETWMTAAECVEKGFADELLQDVKAAACADQEYLSKYKHVPAALAKAADPDEEVKAAREMRRRKLALEISL